MPDKVACQNPLAEAVSPAGFVFLCVPAQALKTVLVEIKPFLRSTAIIVGLSKGVCGDQGETAAEILPNLLPKNQRWAVLGGPMLSEELKKDAGGVGVVGGGSPAVWRSLERLFAGTKLNLEFTTDAAGVSISGVLKNIYASVLGITDGLGWGSNRKGWVAARAVSEMIAAVKQLGGKPKTFLGAAGLGDFLATGYSEISRNHKMGREIAEVGTVATKSEGYFAVLPIAKRLGASPDNFPLLYTLSRVVEGKVSAREAFNGVFGSG